MRLLVIRHRFIGDTLLMLPMLARLRQVYPSAHITVLTASDSAPLLTYCPYINERWVFGVATSSEGIAVPDFWHAVRLARRQPFDAALVLKRSFSSAAMAFLAGIPVRVGFATEGRRWLLTHPVPYDANRHESACFQQVLDRFFIAQGATPPPTGPILPGVWFAPGEEATIVQRWQQQTAGYTQHLGFHIGASNSGKQWPLQRFVETASQWLGASPSHQLHIMGGPGDRDGAEALLTHLSWALQSRVVIWAGQLALRETAVVLKQLDWLVTSDSGLAHLAAAVGTTVHVVFGPTNPIKWHPLGKHQVITSDNPPACMPCNLKVRCQLDHVCLSQVTANQVL